MQNGEGMDDCLMHIKRMLAALLCLMMLVGCALAESTEQQPADFSEKFADKFLAEGENTIIGQELYQSQNLYIQITSFRQDNSDVYVADIYLRSMDCLQPMVISCAKPKIPSATCA